MKLLPGFLGALSLGAVAFLGVLLLTAVALGVRPRQAAADHCATLVASLSGPAINGVRPSGKADWKGNDLCNLGLELKVQVSNVNLPDGSLLTFRSCVDEATGLFPYLRDMTLRGGKAGFELRRSSGDSVPRCDRGNPVEIRHGETVVLSGTWCAPRVQRC